MRSTTTSWWRVVDRTIHHDATATNSSKTVILIVALFGGLYGATMGSYAWLVGGREFSYGIWQVLYSGCKVPLLLFATFLVSLPSFYVLNALLGLSADFRIAVRNILISQATLAVALCSVSPLVIFWYLSIPNTSVSYAASILVNTMFFAFASFASQATLRHRYRELIQHDSSHRWMLWTWLVVFALIGIQMGWVLRPFVGNPRQDPAFLRPEAWDNAYLKLLEIVRRIF